MKVSRWIALAGVAALVATVSTSAALGGSTGPSTHKAGIKAALVSDIIGFNDAGFNGERAHIDISGHNGGAGAIIDAADWSVVPKSTQARRIIG